jgi:putative transposase
LISFARSLYYYQPKRDDSLVKEKLLSLAEKKPMEGQDKFYQRIRNEGLQWNYKRVRRVYKLLGLNKRTKTRKRLPKRVKEPLIQPLTTNQMWSMDFMHDTLENGRKFRTLNIIDDYNREVLAIEVQLGISSRIVTEVLTQLLRERGKPEWIRVDNGPEFISSTLNDWCHSHGVKLQFIQPGKPSQNGFIERFNRTYRQDILDAYIFEDLSQVRVLTEEWIEEYNHTRPHDSLGGMTPIQFRLKNEPLQQGEASFPLLKEQILLNENNLN